MVILFREIFRKKCTKFREAWQFGGLDPRHAPNQIGQD
jgi:hypothetical protein